MHIKQKTAFFSFFDIKNEPKKARFSDFFKNSSKKFAKITKFAFLGVKIGKTQGKKLFAHLLFFQDVGAPSPKILVYVKQGEPPASVPLLSRARANSPLLRYSNA